jgi:hypothetical protein
MKDLGQPLERENGQREAQHQAAMGHASVAALSLLVRSGKNDERNECVRLLLFPCADALSAYLGLARGDDVVQAHAQARLEAQRGRGGGHVSWEKEKEEEERGRRDDEREGKRERRRDRFVGGKEKSGNYF